MGKSHVEFRNEMTVKKINAMGDDLTICQAARVNPMVDMPYHRELEPRDSGLMKMLMRDRHGTPWEHVVFQFYIEAPIFVAREAHRHRIASINEESGRYKELGPVFYMPDSERNLVQHGKPGAYTFTPGSEEQILLVRNEIFAQARSAYRSYQHMLEQGIAREVARMVLPVNIYTSWYLTINLRSLFNFFSLRNKTEATTVPTSPQREIEMIAEQMEAIVTQQVPTAMQLFNENGRISP